MNPREEQDKLHVQQRAAEWLHLLEDAGPGERAEFMDWIGRSPRHLEEFLLVTAVAQAVRRTNLEQIPGVRERLDSVTAAVTHLAPLTFEAFQTEPEPQKSARPRNRWMYAALAAGLAALAAGAALWLSDHEQTYATVVGEQRSIALPDGSVMHLNTGSRVQVRYRDFGRDVRLLEGEVLFDVAPDPQRPFRVQSGASLIQAVGTQFNVLRRPLGTTVTVIEGVVRVAERLPALTAGEEARLTLKGEVELRRTVQADHIAQWKQRRLEFRTEALADIAAQFNRYNATPKIVVIGDAARRRHYSGVFDANDPWSLIEYLRQDPELTIEQRNVEYEIRAIAR